MGISRFELKAIEDSDSINSLSPVITGFVIFSMLSTGSRLWLHAFIRYADSKQKKLFRKDVYCSTSNFSKNVNSLFC
jgi:hypothetical protein